MIAGPALFIGYDKLLLSGFLSSTIGFLGLHTGLIVESNYNDGYPTLQYISKSLSFFKSKDKVSIAEFSTLQTPPELIPQEPGSPGLCLVS